MSLEKGLEAVEQQRYPEAIEFLEKFCQTCSNPRSSEYLQAQVGLARAYYGLGEREQVVYICRQLAYTDNVAISEWAQQWLNSIEATPKYSPEQLEKLLEQGHQALKQKKYPEAIKILEEYCKNKQPSRSSDLQQAKMWLAQAYRGTRQLDGAVFLCEELKNSSDTMIRDWARQNLSALKSTQEKQNKSKLLSDATFLEYPAAPKQEPEVDLHNQTTEKSQKPKRVAQTGVKLIAQGMIGSLGLAAGVTISLLLGMVFATCLSLLLLFNCPSFNLALLLGVGATLLFNILAFFLSPWLMDLTQTWLYQTRWVDLPTIRNKSPEAAEVILRVCRDKKITVPRLGIIDDQNPTAFTYGSLPNQARLVVSQGLFTYLDNDEIATVYAHELGHIVHWDFAIMTLASTIVQILYLISVFTSDSGKNTGNRPLRDAVETTSWIAYLFYLVGSYLLLYLSRTREYHADHFAAEITGNPNGLARALVKIAYGLVAQQQIAFEPSRLLEGTRALGIYDSKMAIASGTVYQQSRQSLGPVLCWDIFNPWAGWLELNSTHPLTGKRLRVLTTYAEQLGLDSEFDLAAIIQAGKNLNKRKLYGNFFWDILLYYLQFIGIILGFLLAFVLIALGGTNREFIALPLIGFGVGLIIKTTFMYPENKRIEETDILTLMSDPYASPLRGRLVKLQGELIGRGDAGYRFGSELKFQDSTGMIYTRYASILGSLGNFFFGASQVDSLIGYPAQITGWFRRGVSCWLDLLELKNPHQNVKSYQRFWSLLLGLIAVIVGFII